jgi:hypothetical protein
MGAALLFGVGNLLMTVAPRPASLQRPARAAPARRPRAAEAISFGEALVTEPQLA